MDVHTPGYSDKDDPPSRIRTPLNETLAWVYDASCTTKTAFLQATTRAMKSAAISAPREMMVTNK